MPSPLASSPLFWGLERARLYNTAGDVVRFVPYPYQAALLSDRSTSRIVLKARQVGITQTIAIEIAHELLHNRGALALVVSRDQRAAEEVVNMVSSVLELLMRYPSPIASENQSEIRLKTGARLVSQPATSKAGRGLRCSSVYLDEFAFAEYAERIYQAVSPTLARGGRLTIISTPDGVGNLFYQLWSGQKGGEWSKHRIHYSACPLFDEAWYESNRPRYSAEQFASEFECDFVTSGGAAFNPDDVLRMREGWLGLQGPTPGRTAITGWDIGRRHDATVGITLDTTTLPYQVVAYERLLKVPYAVSMAKIDARAATYGGKTIVEANSIGDPVIEGLTARVTPFITSARSKADILTRLVRAVEQGEIKCGIDQVLGELRGYQWDDGNIAFTDCVMALAIALSGATTAYVEASASSEEGMTVVDRSRLLFAGDRGNRRLWGRGESGLWE